MPERLGDHNLDPPADEPSVLCCVCKADSEVRVGGANWCRFHYLMESNLSNMSLRELYALIEMLREHIEQ